MDSEDQTGKFRKSRRNKRKTANLCGSFNAEKRNCNSFSCPGKTFKFNRKIKYRSKQTIQAWFYDGSVKILCNLRSGQQVGVIICM